MHRNAGFTLVELMIAVAIIGIGAVLAAPMLTSLMESSRITTTTNNIVEAIATARSEAVRRAEAVKVVPADDADWTAGWEVRLSGDDTVISRFDSIPNTITVTADPAFDSIEFQPNGMRTSTADAVAVASTLTICGTRPNGRQIQLHASGSTKIDSNYAGCP